MVAGLLTTLLVAGCGLIARPAPSAALRFQFSATSDDGYMNQVLTIFNDSARVLAPTLEFTALDANRDPLPTVKVTTVYGSDQGRLVVPPGGGLDVLVFSGDGAQLAEDVAVSVRATEPVEAPATLVEPVVIPMDESGRVLHRGSPFTTLSVRNDGSEPMSVRLVYIIWTEPKGDERQQADRIIPIGDLIVVPPNKATLVPVSGDARTTVTESAGLVPTSIKAYRSR
ncbi:hypothetical protein ACQPWW_13555 [Micromonospora sp. CA-240977]|uniref:hypothetical protein n=1 Tax=Micromonospora sp. CA-240977 TaxID=3239957 RepID=UPI003D9442F9